MHASILMKISIGKFGKSFNMGNRVCIPPRNGIRKETFGMGSPFGKYATIR